MTRVFLLKSYDSEAARGDALSDGWQLPLAVDALESNGIELRWSDAAHRAPWSRPVAQRLIGSLEARTTPFLETLLSTKEIAAADGVLAIFESRGNSLALLRSLKIPPFTRPRLVVMTCWLADLLKDFSSARRALYRFAYRSIDHLVYFSRNQTMIYRDVLGIPGERLAYVPFGIDHRVFAPRDAHEDIDVLAVGRDRGRDWATFLDAVRGTRLNVKIACRPGALSGLSVPENVEILGWVSKADYRDLTARTRVAVIPTQVREYPSGQSVLLEALGMQKCCVVTDTPAIRDYVRHEETALLVQPRCADSLRSAIERAVSDTGLRSRLGRAGRWAVEREFNAEVMWRRVGELCTHPLPGKSAQEG